MKKISNSNINNGNRFWIKTNHAMLGCSMAIGFIVVFILAFANISKIGALGVFLVIVFGVNIVFAIHMLWGLIVEMADNIATITDSGIKISSDEIKTPKSTSERATQISTQSKDTIKPFVVNIEYDDGMWECGNCGQLNDPDCEFCTNCNKSKGKFKIHPPK